LTGDIGGVAMNGASTPRLAGNLNVSFDGIDGEALLLAITDVAVSSGAACTSAEPSHVLTALGLDTRRALASLRFGLGRWTTADEIESAADHLVAVIAQLRTLSPSRMHAVAGGRA
jgi:cysteine desulfurase